MAEILAHFGAEILEPEFGIERPIVLSAFE